MRRLILAGNQPGQSAFLRDRAPGETLYQGGWGSGKSYAGARKLLVLHCCNGCPSAAYAPTYGDLWRFVVPAIVAACDEWSLPCQVHKSIPQHLSVAGEIIWLLSTEDPGRIAGYEVGASWIDEAARVHCDPSDPLKDAPLQIRARLRHPAAKRLHLLLTTTPEGPDTWVEEQMIRKPTPDRRAYYGSTLANPATPQVYKDQIQATLPAQLADQYLLGRAVRFCLDRAHPGFAPATHVRPQALDPARPLHVGQDFNVSPLCWIATQELPDGRVAVVDELVIRDHAQVDQGIHHAHARGWGKACLVVLHPDRSGNARHTVGDSEVRAARDAAAGLGWKVEVASATHANPLVVKRVNLVDRLIAPAAGAPRLVVDPRCVRLIEELQSTRRLKSGGYDPGRDGSRGHILDALGYALWDLCRPGSGAGGW
jgi:hypothetical protein